MKIRAYEIEFTEGGDTIWVHSDKGTTPMRIKCNGKIVVHRLDEIQTTSIQLMVGGDIHVMVPKKREPLTAKTLAQHERRQEKIEKELEEFGWTRRECGGWEDPLGNAPTHLPASQAHVIATQRLKPRARK